MAKILVISAHPAMDQSLANKTVIEEFQKLVPACEVAQLSKLYPDFKIDVKTEQDRLKDAEMVIFQYPFWWYSAPSLLHRYIEDVFTWGWAYGTNGTALKDKNLALSFTIGGSEADYQRMHGVHHTIEQFLPAMLATAAFCGMVYRGAIYSYDMMQTDAGGEKLNKEIVARAKDQANRLVKHIGQFVKV